MNVNNLSKPEVEKLSIEKKTAWFTEKHKYIFLFIIAIAFFLRLQGIDFGQPYILSPEESANLTKIICLFKHPLQIISADIPGLYLFFNTIISAL